VHVPSQTCCGQPAWNSGDRATTRAIAEQVIEAFSGFAYVVAPSGSCAGMIRKHYPEIFADDPNWLPRAHALGAKTHELTSVLVDVMFVSKVEARLTAKATYHDSCSGLREMKVQAQPRKLLRTVEGLELVEMAENDVCCGFGGTFAVKFPELSTAMLDHKLSALDERVDVLSAIDSSCLMQIRGRLQRRGSRVQALHLAEILASR
jgi:L-lactate dehydrogenase complex protein LldE